MKVDKKIKVMIVDDHSVVRSGLGAFLMAIDDLELVGEASSGEEAVQKASEVKPDVILMDLKMQGIVLPKFPLATSFAASIISSIGRVI